MYIQRLLKHVISDTHSLNRNPCQSVEYLKTRDTLKAEIHTLPRVMQMGHDTFTFYHILM